MELKVLTLNCWGLPYSLSKDKDQRIQCIAEELAKGRYNIVALQEVWVMSDFYLIQSTVKSVLPYSHYFRRGFVGSGLCVFSKWPITDTLSTSYSLNGYAHKVTQGDWYAVKMIGMCRIDVEGMMTMVYTTHAHALYAPSHLPSQDEFFAHRLVQMYELSEFVRQTSAGADLTLVLGDFNTEPYSLAAKLAIANAGLLDAWETRQNVEYLDKNTNERLDNHYSMGQTLYYVNCDNGERIDYVLYQSAAGYSVRCRETKLDLQKISGTGMLFSDHEGVGTILEVVPVDDSHENEDGATPNGNAPPRKATCQMTPVPDSEILAEHLQSAISILADAQLKSAADQISLLKKAALFLLLLLLSLAYHPSSAFIVRCFMMLWNCAMTVLLVFYLCFAVVVKQSEKNTLAGSEANMKLRLARITKEV